MSYSMRICGALLALLGGAAQGQEARLEGTGFQLGPRIGPGELRIHGGEAVGDEVVDSTVSEDTIGLGGTLQYRAPFGLVVEGGLLRAGSTDWFDSEEYRFTEYFGSVGYQFELGNGFSITPRVGRARWKLEADNNWFFDDEEDPPTVRGYQNFWEISAMKRITERVSLGVSHKENEHDFGRMRQTVFVAMFDL